MRLFSKLLGTGLLALVVVSPARAQSVWELAPYRVRLLLAFGQAPELTPGLQADLLGDLVERADALVGAPWVVTAAPASFPLCRRLTTAETAAAELPEKQWLEYDKVMLIVVVPEAGGYRVTARELDVHTRTWGTPVWRQVWQLAKLRDAVLDAVFAAFAPLARIDAVEGAEVVLRLKAAALPVRDEEQLALVKPGDVFRPIIRYNDREGNPRRIMPVPWTFCVVKTVAPEQIECQVCSGLRSPLSGRRRGRVEQLALAVVPPQRASTLILVSQADGKQPLAGYEVYARRPNEKGSKQTLLGRTDQQGRITVPPAEDSKECALRVLLVRNGEELLARLPLVPGLEAQCTAEIANDDERLEAEGFITGLQEELVDLVTRREVLLTRARARIKAKQFDQAAELVDELRRLPSQAEFAQTLGEQQKRIRSSNPLVQAKIDALFKDTETLLQKQLDPAAIEDLWQQLRNARGGAR